MRLLLEFEKFTKEQAIIGRMIMAYGEFEFNMAKLVSHTVGDDDYGARILFRVHGEGARLDVTDAIVRPMFDQLGLAGQWGNAFGALRYCKDVRNQYAHCNWYSDKGQPLTFVNMERDVASPEGALKLQLYPTDLALLQKQHEYFEYANAWLYFLDCRCRKLRGKKAPDVSIPKSTPQPPKHNRPKKPLELPEACTTPKERPGES